MPIAISVNMLRLRVTQRLPAAHEERPARPQHDRRRESELHPVRQRRVDQPVRPPKWPPISSDQRPAASSTRPIQNRRVMSASSGLGPAVGGRHFRLERHAADRAGAGARLPDLRVHRAGVDRAFGDRLGVRARRDISAGRRRIWCGSRPSRNNTAWPRWWRGAGGVRIDRHAADRIERAGCGRRVMMVVRRARAYSVMVLPSIPLGGI